MALVDLIRFTQSKQQSLDDFFNEFKAKSQIFKTLGGDLEIKKDTWMMTDGSTVTTNQALLVCLFLSNANRQRYKECTRSLRNDTTTNSIRYPSSLEDAYKMLDEFVAPYKKNNNNPSNNNVES
mmetsp:Transcript_8185/g.19746  ORF Transcript_8185/g.19746 Transcript_8185/m.19746 type:complete len:124 (-) Transcript_8185:7-378(-)